MAVYKFRVTFEDFDEVIREIEIKSGQTFEDLHNAIHKAIGFDGNFASSFYMSNERWHKGKEITLFKSSIKDPAKTTLMADAYLKNFIEDPHQRIYYIFNFDKPWPFLIELIKITIQEDAKITYPYCSRSISEAPKQFGNTPLAAATINEDLDFLNEMELGTEDEEEVENMGFDDAEESEEESDEFSADFDSEFSQEE